MQSPFAIEIKDLFFSYLTPRKEDFFKGVPFPFKKVVNDKKVALHGININIEANKITGLLGKNGSGKTTLIKLISGTRLPESGNIKVFGQSPLYARHRMGVCLGNSLLYNRLTARENLEYFGRLYSVQNIAKRIDELSELLQLRDVLDYMVETYSFGMKAKLAIARSLVHSPELLILDEPTLGIDIHLAKQIRTFVKELKCTVLLTTHYMEEAQELSDNLCLIDKGKITDWGTQKNILDKYQAKGVSEAFMQAIS